MKKLELTTEHMAKIFDMCNFYYQDLTVTGAVIVDGIILFKNLDKDGTYTRLHWVELCLTHLSHKIIFNPKKPLHFCKDTHFRMVDELMKLFYDEDKNTHPVDFLHKEYLKLTN